MKRHTGGRPRKPGLILPVTGRDHEGIDRFVDECFMPMLAQEFLRWREAQCLSADGHPENLTTEAHRKEGGL